MPLTPEQARPGMWFAQGAHESVNHLLRGTGENVGELLGAIEEIVRGMDAAIDAQAPTTKPITVHRLPIGGLGRVKPGYVGANMGFLAAFLDARYCQPVTRPGDEHLVITVPPGTRMLYLPSHGSSGSHEGDLVLPRGSRFPVEHVDTSSPSRRMTVSLWRPALEEAACQPAFGAT